MALQKRNFVKTLPPGRVAVAELHDTCINSLIAKVELCEMFSSERGHRLVPLVDKAPLRYAYNDW